MTTLDPHIIHKMENGIATALCGQTFDATGDWEFGDGGICWKCMERQDTIREMTILNNLLSAGEAWALDPDSGPKRTTLYNALEQLADWMDPGDSQLPG
jgi:hypothetical protein